jgi:Na+/H+ antiporter
MQLDERNSFSLNRALTPSKNCEKKWQNQFSSQPHSTIARLLYRTYLSNDHSVIVTRSRPSRQICTADSLETIAFIMILLTVVVLSAVIARIFSSAIPLPLFQIGLGCVLAQFVRVKVAVEPDVFFLLFLAPLLFLDGWRIPREGLFRDKWTITSLAVGLVLLTVIATGYFVHWLIPTISLPIAFALAAILSPTDTVAVTSIAAQAPIPKRLLLILEGESLLNDATGLVCFRFAVAAAITGTFSLGEAVGTFAWLAAGGIAIGIVTCAAANLAKDWVSKRFGEEVGAQILVSFIIPFAAYLLADSAGTSGILAAVAAGIVMGMEERAGRASAITRIRRSAVWDAVQFSVSGVIFILLGQQLPSIVAGAGTALPQIGKQNELWLIFYVLVISLALFVIRSIWAWSAVRLRPSLGEDWGRTTKAREWRLIAIIALSGARGAVTLAAAMTLPLSLNNGAAFPARDLTILLAAGTIFVSLLVTNVGLRSVTTPFKTLKMRKVQEEREIRSSSTRAAMEAIEGAIHSKSAGSQEANLYAQAGERLLAKYRRQMALIETSSGEATTPKNLTEIEQALRLIALSAQRNELYRIARLRRQSDELIRNLVYEIDLQESQLASWKAIDQ